ncbi:HelD family protein [Acidipropionibacterium jensenii]|uniref:HelD family protein n=1 Tax=Acidipropionibacterium jensenii TaxID=1749 RepID=UPI0026497008|nr:UvrD-helicase domain-containing protein [Acidipropionibacterium jensenii]MDN5977448.1 AAA family ATPase [Acidipropionibacterium jensenii]MDN5995202.1 AAA family ATPase [Acidipropionibacterium jensenii]MDN6426781.1 AAA family ATPase [Acidipropionibacterium jensenii]MDN6441292.1 AAA family ATPase [Acidipropionibacterium jensenii]MDN6480607.1 AAA family ATPase [Acidipropionibacterium jensenii]
MTSDSSAATTVDTVAQEIAAEQAHVDRVYAQLKSDTAAAKRLADASRQIYHSDRTTWVREEDATAMFERDAFAFNAARRLAVLDSEHEGLVFGRLDLAGDQEVRHIGRIGVRDADYEPLVIDWRAPAAEPFYRATASSPMGATRRRVLRCRDDKVIGIEDDLLDAANPDDLPVIGEGALMAALSRARDTRMHSIVATIQAEQDKAIRAPYQGVTTIAGGPGTGKTVVALHRAAFLLYTHRTRLENGGVLVVGPSEVFMNYIERVLPSLGEDSVTLRSVGDLATDVLKHGSDRLDESHAATVKGSLKMVHLLEQLVALPLTADPSALSLRVTVKGEVLTLAAKTLARTRTRILARNRYNRSLTPVTQSLLDQLWSRMPQEAIASYELTREDFDEMVTSQASFRMFLNAWWPPMSPADELARLASPEVMDRVAADLTETDRAVLSASIPDADEHGRRDWSVADVALLDELAAVLGPTPAAPDADRPVFIEEGENVQELVTMADTLSDSRTPESDEEPQDTFAHVLVDEAQDITPMQWRMLRRRGPQASWTIVGDPAQSAYPYPAETDAAVAELTGHAPRRTFRLTKNYRSPAEVFDLAADVISTVHPDADLPEAVRSTGIQPELARTDRAHLAEEITARVSHLVDQVRGTIGVICPPSLIGVARDLVTEGSPLAAWTDRVIPVTTMQAKGLEYDAAVVVDPDDIVAEAPGGVRVLYVALTRPTQRLVVLGISDPTAAAGDHAPWSAALWSHATD